MLAASCALVREFSLIRWGTYSSVMKTRSRTQLDRDEAWVAKAAKQPMVLETVDLGPLGAEDVEVAVEHCGSPNTRRSQMGRQTCSPSFSDDRAATFGWSMAFIVCPSALR